MKRIHFRHRQTFIKRPPQDIYPVNEHIRAPEVRVIDETGEMIGVLATSKAIAMANERGLDLIAVSPKAQPPVAKIMNYGSFKYQQEKQSKKQKAQQKTVELKELRLSPRIGKHDLDVRINQAEKFFSKGDKIIISVILKGREKQHPDLAKNLIADFIKELGQKASIKVEQDVKRQFNKFSAIVSAAEKLD